MAEVRKTAMQIAEEQRASFPEVARAIESAKPETKEPKKMFMRGGVEVHFESLNIGIKRTSITYPMEWFQRHGWTKPVLTLPKLLPSDTYAGLKKPISDGILRGKDTSAHDLKLFLYFLLKDVKETVPINWVSMGVVIANKGDNIGPLDLFEIQIDDKDSEARTGMAEHIDRDKLGYLILITGCYRIWSERNKFQQDKLKGLINAQAINAGLRGDLVTTCLSALSYVYNDSELIKLFAGMDMFHNMFPNSEYAPTRENTIITRYKDCGILSSLSYITDLMQISTDDFKHWILTSSLRDDYNRINVPHQEVSDPYSYMPYMMSLRFSVNCPYSASSNPSMHFYLHLIGCAALQPRSINAVMLDPCGVQAILQNAILFYYANRRFVKSSPISKPGTSASAEGTEDPTPLANEPKTRDAREWLAFLETRFKGRIPEHIQRTVHKKWIAIKDSRPNTKQTSKLTIGQYARSRAAGGLHA